MKGLSSFPLCDSPRGLMMPSAVVLRRKAAVHRQSDRQPLFVMQRAAERRRPPLRTGASPPSSFTRPTFASSLRLPLVPFYRHRSEWDKYLSEFLSHSLNLCQRFFKCLKRVFFFFLSPLYLLIFNPWMHIRTGDGCVCGGGGQQQLDDANGKRSNNKHKRRKKNLKYKYYYY